MIKHVSENSRSSHPEIFEEVVALKGFEIESVKRKSDQFRASVLEQ